MASIELDLPKDFIRRMERIQEEAQEIIDKSLEAGAAIVERYVRNNLRGVLSAEHKHGELINALGTTPAKTDKYGVRNIKIGFKEPRNDQSGSHTTRSGRKRTYYVRTNAMIASVLEHGRSNQKARPFLAPAAIAAQGPVEKAMERTFDEEVAKI